MGSTVYFDLDNDGMKEAVSWVSAEDGLLARDVNGNGRIDNASELFGSATQDGFAKLRELDGNGDGKIDANDAAYAELKVWQDLNQDGISQADELFSVQNDLFFAEIPTTDKPPGSDANLIEAAVGQIKIENITLGMDNVNTTYGGDAELNFAALALPELRGYGGCPNLSIAMSINPELLTLAQTIATRTLTDIATNFSAISGNFDTLLYAWAGVRGMDPASRGPFIDDARKLEFIEELTQRDFHQFRTAEEENPLSIPAQQIMRLYDDVKALMLGRFLAQTAAPARCAAPRTYKFPPPQFLQVTRGASAPCVPLIYMHDAMHMCARGTALRPA